MTEIVLVRHGETDWNAERRVQGHADPSLNERGREQARVLAQTMNGETFDAVYSSDLRRARETADILVGAAGLPPVLDPDLREAEMGSWSGLTVDDIQHRFPEQWARRRAGEQGHDGETRAEVAERVLAAMRRIATAHPGGRVLVVSHGGAIRAVCMAAEPAILRDGFPNCDVVRIRVEGDTILEVH